jgi:hypothetical protein
MGGNCCRNEGMYCPLIHFITGWGYMYISVRENLYTCTRNVGAVVVASICNYWLLLLFSLTLIYMYPQRGGRRGRINMQLLTAPRRRAHDLFMVFVFVAHSGVQHILFCFCFVFHRLVYPMLPASLECLFWIAHSVFSYVYKNGYNYGLLLLFSLTLIYMYPQPVMKCINGQYMPSFLQQLPPITFLEKTKKKTGGAVNNCILIRPRRPPRWGYMYISVRENRRSSQ